MTLDTLENVIWMLSETVLACLWLFWTVSHWNCNRVKKRDLQFVSMGKVGIFGYKTSIGENRKHVIDKLKIVVTEHMLLIYTYIC